MVAYTVPEERWAFLLARQLTGKAYASLSTAEAGDFRLLKDAILRRYDINTKTY